MRRDPQAELSLYCPRCGNRENEYNWTLETASKFSVNGHETPTLISILLRIAEGDHSWDNYRVVCPRCHETLPLRQLPVPAREELLEYIRQVGEEYVTSSY